MSSSKQEVETIEWDEEIEFIKDGYDEDKNESYDIFVIEHYYFKINKKDLFCNECILRPICQFDIEIIKDCSLCEDVIKNAELEIHEEEYL